MQFTQRQQFFEKKWRLLVATILVGLLLGLAGPFGTYPALPKATRYAFWLGLTAAGVVAAVAANAMLPIRLRVGVFRIAALALVSALPMTFVVAWTFSRSTGARLYGATAAGPVRVRCSGSIADRLRDDIHRTQRR